MLTEVRATNLFAYYESGEKTEEKSSQAKTSLLPEKLAAAIEKDDKELRTLVVSYIAQKALIAKKTIEDATYAMSDVSGAITTDLNELRSLHGKLRTYLEETLQVKLTS